MKIKTFKPWLLFFAAGVCMLTYLTSCSNNAPQTNTPPAETAAPVPADTQTAPVDSVSQSLDADAKDVNEARESLKKALDEL